MIIFTKKRIKLFLCHKKIINALDQVIIFVLHKKIIT